jgi:hypothetical protein
MRSLLKAAGVLLALSVLSCESGPPTAAPSPAQMIDPQVTWVSSDGKNAKVNIGVLDQLHVGQRLYAVRDNKMAGLLMVTKPESYWSECLVTASRDVTKADAKAEDQLVRLRVGDHVVREFRNIAQTGLPREQVPRMVPVPYQPEAPKKAEEPPPKDDLEARKRALMKDVQIPVIPREAVEQWIKDHPRPATSGQ